MTQTPIDTANIFNGTIKPPGVGPLYTLGLAGVALVMAILPLIYFGMVVCVAYGTYAYAKHGFFPLLAAAPSIIMLVIAITPIVAGTILSLFMVKPIFARSSDRHQPYGLNPAIERDLYSFIAQICRHVGRPCRP